MADIISELVARFSVEDNASAVISRISASVNTASGDIGAGFTEARAHVNGFGQELETQATKSVSFSEKVAGMANTFTSIGHAVDAVDNIFDRYELTEIAVESATIRLEKAQINYNEAVAKSGANSSEAKDALLSLEVATNRYEAATIRAKSSMVLIGLQAVALVGQYASAAESAVKFAASGTVIATASATISAGLATISAAATGLAASLSVLLLNPIVLALAAVVTAVIALKTAWDHNWSGIQDITRSASSSIIQTIDDIANSILGLSEDSTIVSDAMTLVAEAITPLGFIKGIFEGITGSTDEYSKAVDTNTEALNDNNTALEKSLTNLSDMENALYNVYTEEDRLNKLREKAQGMLGDETEATKNYQEALSKLTEDEAKRVELEEKINSLIEAGLTDTPFYTSLIKEHDDIVKEVAKDKDDLNDAEEKYSKYRDQSIKDNPEYKKTILEIRDAEEELRKKTDEVNKTLGVETPKSFKLADAAMITSTMAIFEKGIPGWTGYQGAATTAQDKVKDPTWSNETNKNITSVGTALTESETKTKTWSEKITGYFGEIKRTIEESLSGVWGTIVDIWDRIYNYLFGASIIPDIYNGFVEWFGKIKESLSTKLSETYTVIVTKWTEIKTGILGKLTEISTDILNKFTEYKTNITTKLSEVYTVIVTKWTEIKTAINTKLQEIMTAINTKMQDIKDAVNTKWTEVQNIFKSVGLTQASIKAAWSSVGSWLQEIWSSWIGVAQGIWDSIQSIWDTAFTAPATPPTPEPPGGGDGSGGEWDNGHVETWAGEGYSDVWPNTYPDVNSQQFAAEGGIIKDKITAKIPGGTLTLGERGPEAIIPLPGYLKNGGVGSTIVTINFNAPVYGVSDIEKAIDEAFQRVQRNIRNLGG